MTLGRPLIPYKLPPDRGHRSGYAPLYPIVRITNNGISRILLRKEEPMAELTNPIAIQGKFPYLQEDLKQKLDAAHQRCVDAARLIERAATARAEMYEQMADEAKAGLEADKIYFQKMEG